MTYQGHTASRTVHLLQRIAESSKEGTARGMLEKSWQSSNMKNCPFCQLFRRRKGSDHFPHPSFLASCSLTYTPCCGGVNQLPPRILSSPGAVRGRDGGTGGKQDLAIGHPGYLIHSPSHGSENVRIPTESAANQILIRWVLPVRFHSSLHGTLRAKQLRVNRGQFLTMKERKGKEEKLSLFFFFFWWWFIQSPDMG